MRSKGETTKEREERENARVRALVEGVLKERDQQQFQSMLTQRFPPENRRFKPQPDFGGYLGF